MKNLFSMLTEEQLNSLTKEERNQLFQIDQKLFPDDGRTSEDWLTAKLQRMKQEEEESERYAREMEANFQ